MMLYEKYMSKSQKDFANHLLQVMVEIQNHDNIPRKLGELLEGNTMIKFIKNYGLYTIYGIFWTMFFGFAYFLLLAFT